MSPAPHPHAPLRGLDPAWVERTTRAVWRAWLAVLLGAAALGIAVAACERHPPEAKAPAAPAAEVSDREVAAANPPTIVILGDSLTAAFGLEAGQGYPSKLQARLEAEGYPYRVVNAGISGDTSAGGLERIDWVLRQAPEILIVELGANDGLRGQDPENTRQNLSRIIEKGQTAGARVVLAGMKMPVNFGRDYKQAFDAIYPALADKYDVPLIPFILDGVAGRRDLNLPDGIHPTSEGYEIVADNVWAVLEPLLRRG